MTFSPLTVVRVLGCGRLVEPSVLDAGEATLVGGPHISLSGGHPSAGGGCASRSCGRQEVYWWGARDHTLLLTVVAHGYRSRGMCSSLMSLVPCGGDALRHFPS